MSRKPNDTLLPIIMILIGIMIGFLIGVSIPLLSIYKLSPLNYFPINLLPKVDQQLADSSTQNQTPSSSRAQFPETEQEAKPERKMNETSTIWVSSNPRGAERLPPGIVVSESDLYLRRLWGLPSQDLTYKPRYLVTFTVGYDQRENINAAVKKFSGNFTILLFHYDGKTSGWDHFEWSKRAIHVSARKQTKWWFAKRFLHPDIVAAYDYIFVWDEDLGVNHFDAEKYIELVKKHGLEISQPGLEPNNGLTWQMTKRRGNGEIHKEAKEKPGWCKGPHSPPCAGFVEIMAPVFSRDAWRCVWYLIQNDLVHGWGLDFALQKCIEPAHEKIGVVDAQWVVHKRVPSLGNQGEQTSTGGAPWRGVRQRCEKEWKMFEKRLENADKAFEKEMRHSSQKL